MIADVVLARPKRVAEKFRLRWDFTGDLEALDSISSEAITAKDQTGADATAAFTEMPQHTASTATVTLKAGTPGQAYYVSFQVTTSQGDVFERVALVSVVE